MYHVAISMNYLILLQVQVVEHRTADSLVLKQHSWERTVKLQRNAVEQSPRFSKNMQLQFLIDEHLL